MRRTFCFLLILVTAGCDSKSDVSSTADDGPAGKKTRVMTRPGPFLEEPAKDLITAKLEAGKEDSPFAPRYSPPGKRLDLKPVAIPESLGWDGLETEVKLGFPIDKQVATKVLVCRSAEGELYNKLVIDTNGNGLFDDEPIVATHSESRGNLWSNFTATLHPKYDTQDSTIREDYPVALWIAVASKTERPEMLRMSRRGFKSGEVTIGDRKATIVVSDSNNDAVFGEGDWWELRAEGESPKGITSRGIGDYHWFGDSAYKLSVNDASASSVKLEQFDPGKTREQDELDRDPYGVDKRAVKAEKPLEFRHDADDAIAEAKASGKRCFIKFETTWCGPCKTMTQYVFTAKDVVDASKDIVCIKVDGDERRDLVERFSVNAYPTGVLLSGDGAEASRFVGYQKVVKMAKFLTPKN